MPLLFITQNHLWELFHRDYTLKDQDGRVIAKLSRNNLASLFRRGWTIMEPSGATYGRVREDSVVRAIIRRVIGNLIAPLIKTDFHFLKQDATGNERKIGAFNRRISVFDKYVLDLSEDPQRTLDRRVALGVGILLDTAEKR